MKNKFVFGALVGSQNYGLAGPQSDSDYKLFVLPTFDDLYFRSEVSTSKITEKVDYTVHDIRKFASLVWKANPNFIEVLFSKRFIVNKEYAGFVDTLLSRKNELASANLPAFFNASFGNYLQKRKDMVKGTAGTADLVEKYGYDTKCFLHAYRALETLDLYRLEFTFDQIFHYVNTSLRKNFALALKNGQMTLDQAYELLDEREYNIVGRSKKYFMDSKPNKEVKEWLDELVYDLVVNHLTSGK